MTPIQPVSVHGGHSCQFCNHASDTLEEMIKKYIDCGYPWVGITEHMPPVSNEFVYPDEKDAGLDADALQARFTEYLAECRRLQAKYADQIRIYVGFETEDTSGGLEFAKKLIDTFSPDYIVGSIHHVHDIPFDYNRPSYSKAVDRCGGVNGLYETYFDRQLEMIVALKPRVVGHLDIIRIYDDEYRQRIGKPAIWRKIVRNLELIKKLNLILDFNLRPLSRGETEPYLSTPILIKACELGIDVVPGDDSHRLSDIGIHMNQAIQILINAGGNTRWRTPV